MQHPDEAPSRLRRTIDRDRLSIEILSRDVCDPAPQLRYLAGEDAKLLATAYRELELEASEELMRKGLDWQD